MRESVACTMGTKGRLVAAEIRKINCMSNFQWQPSFNMAHGQELRSYASDSVSVTMTSAEEFRQEGREVGSNFIVNLEIESF